MRIKRFAAPDIRTAIRLVRETLGPDAVILSNRRGPEGVEIVAAVDYDEAALLAAADEAGAAPEAAALAAETATPGADLPPAGPAPRRDAPATEAAAARPAAGETAAAGLEEVQRELHRLRGLVEGQLARLAWGELKRTRPQEVALLGRLTELGLAPRLARRIAAEAAAQEDAERAWRAALGLLAHALPMAAAEPVAEGGVVALVGATGVGKTTMVAKLAARCALRHGRRSVALVTTDSYRIGAQEQLRTFARILDVPLRVAEDAESLREAIAALSDRHLVLVDTAGMSQRDVRLSEQLALLAAGGAAVRSYLVLSATTQRQGLEEVVRAFRGAAPAGCMVTKVDEAGRLGDVLSVVIEHRLPVAYVGNGQRVPEDLQLARAHNLVSLAMAMGQRHGGEVDEEVLAAGLGPVLAGGAC
ncbi:flagellar biosynthesis protein FlhF [Inmirania thermothiophila]|uniref:Flagellar biosynthesis protein FlhF n=1 Tax=Inmirania thermothiophila TaxID=1750597 RepID=A0A3N1Y7Z5_9GAMM|nr:flagellar biosynthesis protein FlhF [Inmirania thermothiophila]ROR34944.1 flagellar biosynthesis protein FlhF [Inmirania thermothiophila]